MQGPVDLPPPPPLRARSVGEILEAAFGLYAKHWQSLIRIVAVVVVPITIVQYAIGDAVSRSVTTSPNGNVTVNPGGGGTIAGSGLVGLIAFVMWQILIGAVAWAVASTLVGREPDVGEAYRFGYRRFWSVLLVGILVGLAVFAGLILLVVPGIIIAVRLSVSIPALVVERRRGTDALGRSWNLVKGYSWPVFGAFIVVAVLNAIVNGALTAIGGNGWFLRSIFAAIGACITTPFFGLVLGLIYFDLRVRKENLDVATLDRELQAASA
jgi:hypothetical protein